MEDINNFDLNQLLDLKNSIESKKQNYYNILKKIDKNLKDIDFTIYKKCNHEWEREYSGGPYDRAEQICKFCNLYRNNFRYM